MNSKSLITLLAALIVIPATAFAQDATTSTRTVDSSTDDQLTRGGTGTGTRTEATAETSTRTIGGSTDDQLTRGGTGTGTRTLQATAPVEASMAICPPFAMDAPGQVRLGGESGFEHDYPAPAQRRRRSPGRDRDLHRRTQLLGQRLRGTRRSGADLGCRNRRQFHLVVDCAAVPSDRKVTITGGTATAEFDLLGASTAN